MKEKAEKPGEISMAKTIGRKSGNQQWPAAIEEDINESKAARRRCGAARKASKSAKKKSA